MVLSIRSTVSSAMAASACAAIWIATSGVAAAQPFLPPPEAIKILADGGPWTAQVSGGMKAKITFNKDGTGVFEGPLTLPTTWAIKGDAICLNLRVASTKCLRFRQTKGGLEGWEGDKLDIRLTR